MPGLMYHQYGQLNKIRGALNELAMSGLGPGSEIFDTLTSIRSQVLSGLGIKVPKPMMFILKLVGMSPGEVKLWHDSESGWLAEAREKPGAPPVYHYINSETAAKILTGKLTHEEFEVIMIPDPYLGE